MLGLDYPRAYASAPGKTFVVDALGNRYEFQQGSGLSGGFWAGVGGWQDPSFLTLPPGGKASASFMFRRRQGEGTGKSFTFSSEQIFVRFEGTKATPQRWFNITIRNIEPR